MVDYSQKAANALLESLQISRETTERGFNRVQQAIEEMAVNIGQLSQQIKIQSQNISRLEQAIERTNSSIDRLTAAVDNHLRLAESQSATAQQQASTIGDLTRLVAAQSEMVNRLLERAA